MNSKEKEYIVVGVDGGGSKVSAGIIESNDNITFTFKSFSHQYYNESIEYISGYSPKDMATQLYEHSTEQYNINNEEKLQGKEIIKSFHDTIINLNVDKPILLGVGMVGLKTKDFISRFNPNEVRC